MVFGRLVIQVTNSHNPVSPIVPFFLFKKLSEKSRRREKREKYPDIERTKQKSKINQEQTEIGRPIEILVIIDADMTNLSPANEACWAIKQNELERRRNKLTKADWLVLGKRFLTGNLCNLSGFLKESYLARSVAISTISKRTFRTACLVIFFSTRVLMENKKRDGQKCLSFLNV